MKKDKHIYEGWHVSDFISELETTFPYQTFRTKEEVREWCKSNQPYYKKHIPQVANYFIKKAKL